MRNYLFLAFCGVFIVSSFTQKEDTVWLSYQQAVENEQDPEQRVERILDIAFYALDQAPDSTMKYADLAYKAAQKADYVGGMISAEMVRGYFVRNKHRFDEAITHFEKAKKLNEPLNKPLRDAQIDDTIAGIYVMQGRFEEALEIKEKCLQVFKMENDTGAIQVGLNGIGGLLNQNGDYTKATKYFKECLGYCTSRRDFSYIYGNLGISYRHLNKPDSAIYFYKKGIEFSDAGPKYMAKSYANIGILQKTEKLFDDALESFQNAEKAAIQLNDQDVLAVIYKNFAFLYYDMKDYPKAQKYIDQSKELIESQGEISDKRDLRNIQYRVAEKLGRFEQANQYLNSYKTIQDSMKSLEVESRIAEFETKYKTVEKEKIIVEQQAEIERKKTQRNRLIIGLIAALWFGLFAGLYFWNRGRLNKIISNQESELQQVKINELEQEKKLLSVSSMLEGQENERMRIAQDLHDSIGGLLTSVKAHFGVIQKEIRKIEAINLTEKVNELIDEASTEVRRISHNMAPRALKLYGLKEAISDLTQQVLAQDGLGVEFEWNGEDRKELLDDTQEIMLYRIVQEALNNVMKHARAKHVLVQVNVFDGELNLTIEDDGIGFDLEVEKSKKSLGLKSIESRVDFLNGKMEFDSRKDQGTTLSIQMKHS